MPFHLVRGGAILRLLRKCSVGTLQEFEVHLVKVFDWAALGWATIQLNDHASYYFLGGLYGGTSQCNVGIFQLTDYGLIPGVVYACQRPDYFGLLIQGGILWNLRLRGCMMLLVAEQYMI